MERGSKVSRVVAITSLFALIFLAFAAFGSLTPSRTRVAAMAEAKPTTPCAACNVSCGAFQLASFNASNLNDPEIDLESGQYVDPQTGATSTWTLNAAGQVDRITTNGRTLYHQYNAAGQITQVRKLVTGTTTVPFVTMTYDADGVLESSYNHETGECQDIPSTPPQRPGVPGPGGPVDPPDIGHCEEVADNCNRGCRNTHATCRAGATSGYIAAVIGCAGATIGYPICAGAASVAYVIAIKLCDDAADICYEKCQLDFEECINGGRKS